MKTMRLGELAMALMVYMVLLEVTESVVVVVIGFICIQIVIWLRDK